MILHSGCKYLSLYLAGIVFYDDDLHLKNPLSLKYLDVDRCVVEHDFIEEILGSCYSLEKLALNETYGVYQDFELTPKIIDIICNQNGKTLEVLGLSACLGVNTSSLQQIFENCTKLKEINLGIGTTEHDEKFVSYVAENLPSRIEKLDLSQHRIDEQSMSVLTTRCKNLKSLRLSWCGLTNNSLIILMNNLRNSLEEFEFSEDPEEIEFSEGSESEGSESEGESDVTLATIMQLGSMPKLKILNYCYEVVDWDDTLIEQKAYLEDNLPHLSINEKSLAIGLYDRDNPENGFWEIQSKRLKMFNYHKYDLSEDSVKVVDVFEGKILEVEPGEDEDMEEVFPTWPTHPGPYQCEICQAIRETKLGFVNHIESKHSDVLDEEVLFSMKSDLCKS